MQQEDIFSKYFDVIKAVNKSETVNDFKLNVLHDTMNIDDMENWLKFALKVYQWQQTEALEPPRHTITRRTSSLQGHVVSNELGSQ